MYEKEIILFSILKQELMIHITQYHKSNKHPFIALISSKLVQCQKNFDICLEMWQDSLLQLTPLYGVMKV